MNWMNLDLKILALQMNWMNNKSNENNSKRKQYYIYPNVDDPIILNKMYKKKEYYYTLPSKFDIENYKLIVEYRNKIGYMNEYQNGIIRINKETIKKLIF